MDNKGILMDLTSKEFSFAIKSNLRAGVGLAKKLPDILAESSFQRIGFIIDDHVFNSHPWLSQVVKDCEKKFSSVIVELYREQFEPTYEYLDRVKLKFKNGERPLIDCIVGIGGGSVIDSAKGIATLANNHGPALEYRGFPTTLNPSLPVIAIPTTAGSGSEASFNASFIDGAKKVKMGINTTNNYPFLAVHDPLLVCGAPRSVMVSSGVDALVHGLEAYVSKKGNDVSKIFGREAVRIILPTLTSLLERPDDLELWARMQLGAYLAMISLANSSSGPAAGLSYLLGTHFNVPHGIAGGVFLGKVARLNHDLGYYGYQGLYEVLPDSSDRRLSEKEKSDAVLSAIERLLRQAGIPDTLGQYGVGKQHLELFNEFAVKTLKGSFDANPAAVPEKRITEFLAKMM